MNSESQPGKDNPNTPAPPESPQAPDTTPPVQPVTVGQTENVTPHPPAAPARPQRGPLTDEDITEALRQAETVEDKIRIAIEQVHDPEIPVNIYELGLVYDVQIDDDMNVKVIMTLTSPACPAAQEIPLDVQRQVGRIAEVGSVEVEITFDPPWTPDRMSDVAKLTLGFM